MAHRRALLALVAGGVAVFLVLTALVILGHIDGMDVAVRSWAQTHARAPWHATARVVTDVLSPLVDAAVLAVAGGAAARRRRRLAPLLVATVVGCATSAAVIVTKHGVERPAPFVSPTATGGLSFPSGHTAATLVFLATAVMVVVPPGRHRRRLLTVVAGLTVLCAAALVYAGYHWLSDTLASAALGTAVLATVRLWEARQPANGAAAATSFADTFAP